MEWKSGIEGISSRIRTHVFPLPGLVAFICNNGKLVALIVMSMVLLSLLGVCYSSDFLRANSENSGRFIVSLQFLFFAGSGVFLLQKKLSEKLCSAAVLLASFAYFCLFYGTRQQITTLPGDNLCQVAYWKILFNPNLSGSIGASYTKPGQIVFLGVLSELNALLGGYAFSIGMCLVMACCVWCLVLISMDYGGRAAAVIALPVACGAFVREFMHGSFSIFLIPVLFFGIRLYFYTPGRKAFGRLLLMFSIHFHIQAVTVLGAIWVELVAKKEWKEWFTFSGLGLLSLALWGTIIFRVQGSLTRLNSGAAAGYIAPYNNFDLPFEPGDRLGFLLSSLQEGFADNYYYIMFMSVLAVVGVAGSFSYGFRQYITVFSVMPLLLFNVLVLGGEFNYERYCSLFYAFAVAVGIGVVVRLCKENWRERKVLPCLLVSITATLFIMMFDFSQFTRYSHGELEAPHYVTSASNLLADKFIPAASRLMTEDDLLYPLVVMQPSRYPKLVALQYFNIAAEAERKKILSSLDYIWIAIDSRHLFYYLEYLPDPGWLSDPFRLMIVDMLYERTTGLLYGYRFELADINSERLIVKVMPARPL
jgi:hypothetical protein